MSGGQLAGETQNGCEEESHIPEGIQPEAKDQRDETGEKDKEAH